jgi:hypothetical protein
MDPPWQTGGAQQAHANLKKATHEQAFLVHASSRKLYARALEALVRQPHVSIDHVAQLYAHELTVLTVGARITGCLTILTTRKVREILRQRQSSSARLCGTCSLRIPRGGACPPRWSAPDNG